MENMSTEFTNPGLLQSLSEILPSFFESNEEEFRVKGENGLTDYMLVRPGSTAYQKLVNEKVIMFPYQDENQRLVFWYPVPPEA